MNRIREEFRINLIELYIRTKIFRRERSHLRFKSKSDSAGRIIFCIPCYIPILQSGNRTELVHVRYFIANAQTICCVRILCMGVYLHVRVHYLQYASSIPQVVRKKLVELWITEFAIYCCMMCITHSRDYYWLFLVVGDSLKIHDKADAVLENIRPIELFHP